MEVSQNVNGFSWTVVFEKNGDIATSDEAEFIELNYQEPTLMGVNQGEVVTYSITTVEGGRIASFLDSHKNDIMFINCGVCDVNASVTRNGQTLTASYRLTIKADNATYEVDDYTYTLTGTGKLLENVVRNQVPKIFMSFGNPYLQNPNATMVRYNDNGSTPVGTVLDQNGWRQIWMNTVQRDGVDKLLPYQASFYTFKPETDGLLTVRGFFANCSNNAYFVDSLNLAPKWISAADLTNRIDKTWGGINETQTQYAPAVETLDDHNLHQMRERYRGLWSAEGENMFGNETPITQTVTGLPNGTYKLVVYANAHFIEGRNVKDKYGNLAETLQASDTQVAAICCQNNLDNRAWITPRVGGSVSITPQEQEITVDGIIVTDGTLKIDFQTYYAYDDGTKTRGVNWLTIQIKSLEMNGYPVTPNFTPVKEISAPSNNNEEVVTNIHLEKDHTYYLYANTPNTNGGGWETYQLHSFTFIPAISFADWSYVLKENNEGKFEIEHTQTIIDDKEEGVTYSIQCVPANDISADVESSTGRVYNIEGKGGAIIVTASKGDDSDFYVITKPYKTNKWTFANVTYTDSPDLVSDLQLNADRDWGVNYKVRNYNETTRNLEYINVSVLSNNTALDGENAAYIGATAGLLVEGNSRCFGSNAPVKINKMEGVDTNDAAAVDAALRAMLLYTKNDVKVDETNMITFKTGAKITIPNLKAGQYVCIKMARYSGNNGESLKLTNLDDLNGNSISKNLILSSVHNVNSGSNEFGYFVFKVHQNGPVSFEPQDNGWTNIYSIQVADKFKDIDYVVSEAPQGIDVADTDLRLAETDETGLIHTKAPIIYKHDYGKSMTYQYSNDYYSTNQKKWMGNPSLPCQYQNGFKLVYSLEGLDGSSDIMESLTAEVTPDNGGNGVKGRRNANGEKQTVTTSFDPENPGLLTIAGQGQCVVVQKVYATDVENNEYLIDIQRTVITITQDVDITWDYPYTWDFTNISSDTKTKIGGTNGEGNENWQKNADGSFKATDSFKNTFVQGGMLSSTGTYENLDTDEDAVSGTGNRISEYEGLGFKTETNAASSATGLDVIGITVPTDKPQEHGGAGGMVIGNKETTVVVPNVPAGMTVYVRVDPQENASVNVNGVTTKDFSATDSITQNPDEEVYHTTIAETGDVELKFKNVVVKGIAVSDFTKTCYFRQGDTHWYYNTDSHYKPIDYTLTKYYTNNAIRAYMIDIVKEKSVTLGVVEKGPEETGYVVATEYTNDTPVQRPLFVPCANDIKYNKLTKISATSRSILLPHLETRPIEDFDPTQYDYYVLTNIYYQVNQETDEIVSGQKTASMPGFYRVVSGDNSNLHRYRAYLKLAKPTSTTTGVKAIPLFDFDGELVDAIDVVPAVATDGIDVNGTFYTLQGMKIQGLPKQGGVYIQNGKKVMVK